MFASSSAKLLFIVVVILIIMGFVNFRNYNTRILNPIFYSPWLMPVYKYKSDKNDVEPYYWTHLLWGLLIAIGCMWSLGVTFMIKPMNFGVALTCIVECIMFIYSMYCNTHSLAALAKVKSVVDRDIVKQAWLQSKTNLVNTLSLQTANDYVSYEEWWSRRFHMINHINLLQGKNIVKMP